MFPSPFVYLAALAGMTLASASDAVVERAEPQQNADQFHAQANELIAKYIDPSVWAAITPAVAAAASAAKITGAVDPVSRVLEALEADTPPAWLSSAIPSQYSLQFAALESAIVDLRPGGEGSNVVAVPTVIAMTTTGSDGVVYTTSISTTQSITEGPSHTATHTAGDDGTDDDNVAAIPTAVALNAVAAALALAGLAIAL